MRHAKHTFKVGRNAGHRRSLIANMLKALIAHGRVETTVTKAKELRRHADRLITTAKKGTLAGRRKVTADLMISYNPLTTKESRAVKKGSKISYNDDRTLVDTLFNDLAKRFETRNGGFTRIIKLSNRVGDNAPTCILEYLA